MGAAGISGHPIPDNRASPPGAALSARANSDPRELRLPRAVILRGATNLRYLVKSMIAPPA